MPSGSRIVIRTAAEADIPTPDTDQVALFMDSDAANAPAYKDDTGTVSQLAGAPGADAPPLSEVDHGNTGSSEDIDVSAGDVHRLVFNAATVTITTTGWPASGTPAVARLFIEQDGIGGRLASWEAAFDWGSAGAPTLQTAPGAIDVIDIQSIDGGTTVLASVPGRQGPAGSNGSNGAAGAVGGAVSIPYTFSTTTTDSDPGNGVLRLSNATQTSATVIRADLLASDASDWSAILATLADASNTVKGHIRLFKASDPTKWLLFTVSAVASPSGYKNITVANVAGSASSPLLNGDAIYLEFSRSGDQGSTIGAGTVTTVEEVDGSPTDSAVTKIVFPNGTLGIAAHVATYTPATPSFHTFHGYRGYNAGSVQTLATSVWVGIIQDSEAYDTDGYHFTSDANLTGTVTKASGSPNIVGSSTLFTSELSVGQIIKIPGTATEYGVVKTITDNTHLALWTNMANSASGQTATRVSSGISIPVGLGGYYHMAGSAGFAPSATGIRNIGAYLNDTTGPGTGTRIVDNAYTTPGAAPNTQVTLGGPYHLNDGDFVNYVVQQNTGGNLNTVNFSVLQPYFSISLLGI